MFLHEAMVKIILLCVSLQFLYSLALPNSPKNRRRSITSVTNISTHNANEQDSASADKKIEELCGSELVGPENRRKRSAWISLNDSSRNESTTSPEKSADYSHLSDSFLNCTHIYLEPECYELLSNESIYIPLYKMVFDKPDYLISEDRLLYICPDIFITKLNSQNESTTSPEKSTDYSHLSDSFLNCTHIYLEPECYELLSNDSVYIPLYKMVFDKPDYLIDEDRLLYICSDIIITTGGGDAFADHTWIISTAGATISSVCLILHIVMYVTIRTPRNLSGRCLLSLCIALLCAYISTFLQHAATTPTSCLAVGMLMVYFFLASFFWMNVFSYDVWRSMRLATTKLRMTRNRPATMRFARYSAYAWGSPAAILIASAIIHHSTSNVKYQLVFDDVICWFKHRQAMTLYFAGPLFVLLGINIVLTVYSFVIISNASFKIKSGGNSSSDSFHLRARFALSIRLCSSMGLMWIFGIIAIITRQEWLWYLYTICSALQGVFIFFSFTVSERSRGALRRALNRGKCPVIPTQSSSQPA